MPKVAYSEEDREKIRERLILAALERISSQGIQHTTVEQIYQEVGISRSFFYSFFPTKEDLVVETLYFQQPRVLALARRLMSDPALGWRQGITQFLNACCYGEKSGIAVLSIEDQQRIFRRLSPESARAFRERQIRLFGSLLECFGVNPNQRRVALFTNLCLTVLIIRRAIPETLPFFVPEAADESVACQIRGIVDLLEGFRREDSAAP
ncbi:TetR/AcrR family transcriptional regulator [Faecalibacterium gallinarum]|uniref:HTH tetR-type domain-containing protein n=1 Tax=Faecalibacterium gallinarum TaxID=2903556 RepID=A0AA37J0F4_9FIRM|nr:TetR/AcrR family transcriptional regulator [Faecalibacterium gallinarum]GJN65583.1 hypothetical protein JCM17207_22080 [Faecalibacterium gallinarum]